MPMPKMRRPFGEHVERRQFLGQHDGIALRQDDDAGAEPDRRGMRGDESQRDRGIDKRRHRAAPARAAPADRAARYARRSRGSRNRRLRRRARPAAACGSAAGPKLIPNSAIFMVGSDQRGADLMMETRGYFEHADRNPKPSRALPGTTTMRCPQCGFESAPDSAFCGRCGARLMSPRPADKHEYALTRVHAGVVAFIGATCSCHFFLGGLRDCFAPR